MAPIPGAGDQRCQSRHRPGENPLSLWQERKIGQYSVSFRYGLWQLHMGQQKYGLSLPMQIKHIQTHFHLFIDISDSH